MVESKSGYPYVEGEYGIPFKDLPANTKGMVRGGFRKISALRYWEQLY